MKRSIAILTLNTSGTIGGFVNSFLLLALSSLFPLDLAAARAGAHHPNIVIFLVDDMGLMDTSVAMLADADGNAESHPLNQWYRTPNMQRLADQGIRFSQFYAQSVCSPTRITLMTGQNSARHLTTNYIAPTYNRDTFTPVEYNWNGIGKDDLTLPRILQNAGYRTIMVGKGHFGGDGQDGANPLNLGFDLSLASHHVGRPGSYYGEKGYGKGTSAAVPDLEKYHGSNTFLTEALTLEANALVTRVVQDSQPFFLYFSHYAVHGPFNSDPRFAAHYEGDNDKSASARAFATLIEGMDKSLGDLLDQLETLGIAEETMILFLGDNGSAANIGSDNGFGPSTPLRGKKGSKFQGGSRVPFIASWAKPNEKNPIQQSLPIARGAIQTQLGTIDDIFPTVLALADTPNPAGHPIDGFPLQPQLSGKRNEERSESFLIHFPHKRTDSYFTSFRQGDWKVIYSYNPENPQQPSYELYNLEKDRAEAHNLSRQYPEKLAAMVAAMAADLEAKNAAYPVDESGTSLKPRQP